MTFLYSAVLAVVLLLSLPYWAFQMLHRGKYRAGLAERLGRVPARILDAGKSSIWVHAVSVGEVLAVSGVIQQLRTRFPDHRVVVSTTTATGQKLARERFGDANVFFFPLDFTFALRPYFAALRPDLIVIAETELWPNFFRLAHARGAKIAVINARISDRSFPRYRLVARWLAPVLDRVDLFLAQGREDAGRIVAIGASPERVESVGNLKFDIPPGSTSPLVQQLRGATPPPVVVCGSTVEGEEPIVLDAFRVVQQRFPDALFILAPRHPERFQSVADLLAASGLRFCRRSQWSGERLDQGGVFLLDTIGELADVYQLANVAFIGGSLVPRGGHNILEAARFGVPVIVGPYTGNFRDMMNTFLAVQAVRVSDAAHLGDQINELLSDSAVASTLGEKARATWRAHTGATERTLARIESLMSNATPPVVLPHEENA
jgi:3-deoxy-D-manno-octulosonic-acid transferase